MSGIEPKRIAPDDLVGDEGGPGLVLTAESAAELVALADHPTLAHLLGPRHFALLAHEATKRAQREQVRPADLLHSLIVHRAAPLPDDVPSRMAADVVAVEREISVVGELIPRCAGMPRLSAGALSEIDRDTLRASRLETIRALGIVPVGYRVDGYVRRVRAGKLPEPPERAAQTVVVYELGLANPVVWCRAVSHAEGRMLSLIALGETLGEAIDAGIAPDGFSNKAAALHALDFWLREGLFTNLLPGDISAA
jgi:hypothetical protein